jgi:serine/threonine protein kinase
MGACTIPGKFAIVMELLDGNLEELLFSEEGSKMRLFQRLVMAKEAALGMNRLHKTEPAIIHRDFKLENLMVRHHSQPAKIYSLTNLCSWCVVLDNEQYKRTDQTYITKVADFGLAAIKPKAKKTIKADPRGTPLTRAPEVWPPFASRGDIPLLGICFTTAA